MEPYSNDRIDQLGFEDANTFGVNLKRCLRCYSLVEAQYAAKHWEAVHEAPAAPERASWPRYCDYLIYIEHVEEPDEILNVDEVAAVRWADRYPKDVVMWVEEVDNADH